MWILTGYLASCFCCCSDHSEHLPLISFTLITLISSKILLSLVDLFVFVPFSTVAIASKKLVPVGRRTFARIKNIVNIRRVHENILFHQQSSVFIVNSTCGTIYCQLCGKSLYAGATQGELAQVS